MNDSLIVVYDTAEHTELAIAALRRAGVPDTSIHRHIREGDDLDREHPPLVEVEGGGIWSTLFGTDHPVEHLVPEGSVEAGGTVIRVTRIPAERYDAVLDILERYHPSDVQATNSPTAQRGNDAPS